MTRRHDRKSPSQRKTRGRLTTRKRLRPAFEGLEGRALLAVLPPIGTTVYIQTNGPSGAIGLGDWYTNTANGVGAGYHYFDLNVPRDWPTDKSVSVDLYSPEMNSNAPASDEVGTGGPLSTTFELYAPGTAQGPAPNQPGPGAPGSLMSHTYAPSGAPEQWERFTTLAAPVSPGRYILRAETRGGDQNGWKLRIGYDNDNDPTNAPPANYDNPDGLPGTDDELTIGINQTSFQHNVSTAGPGQFLTLYSYVAPGQSTVAFHNFDMDGNQVIRYYSPSQTADPVAASGGTLGTLSGNAVWNNGTGTSRGTGDVINNPEPGWWKVVTGVNANNQYIQEGQAQVASYYLQPPTPVMTLTKDDGTTTAAPGDLLTYTITFNNVSSGATAGAALNSVISDTLPAQTSFVSATIDGPYTGTLSLDGNLLTAAIPGAIFAGASGTIHVTVRVDPNDAPGVTIQNNATMTYQDGLGNDMLPANASDTDTVAVATDLQVTNDDGLTTVAPGATVSYTVVVTNGGPLGVAGAGVSYTIPAALTNVSYVAAGAGGASGFSPSGTGAIDDTVNMPAGSKIAYTVTGTVSASASGSFSTTATVTPPEGATDTNTANNTATDTDTVTQDADLAVTVSVDDLTPNVGQTITYTVNLTNDGPLDATGVAVSDVLPAGLTLVSAFPGVGSYNSVNGLWTVGPLTNGVTQALTLVARVDEPISTDNTATVSASDQPDPVTSNNSDNVIETPQQADLSVSQSVDNPTPNVGDTVTFTVSLADLGTDPATNVVVDDTFPAGLSLVSATASQGVYHADTGRWSVGTVGEGPATLTFVARVTQPTTQTNEASVLASDQYDPVSENNAAFATETPQEADLGVTNTVDNQTPNVGDTVTITIALTNHGPDAATNVSLNDTLPAGLALVSATPAQGSYNAATGVWTVGSLAANAGTSLTLAARVVGPNSGLDGVTIRHSDQYDPDPSNSQADATETPQQADLKVAAAVDDAMLNVGQDVTYTITLGNKGPDAATNVSVNDLLPAGRSFVSASSSRGFYNNATGRWTVGTVPADASLTLTLVAAVTSPGTQTDEADVSASDQYDPDSSNNLASVSDTPQRADLTLAKTVDDLTPNVGDVVTFTITLGNDGPDAATHVSVSDTLPAGLSFVLATPGQGTYDGTTGVWTVGTVPSGAGVSLKVKALVVSPGPQMNVASVAAADQFDPNLSNDTAEASETPQRADLGLAVAVDNDSPVPGTNVTLTVSLTNRGPDPATGVSVDAFLPPGLVYVSSNPSQGTYDPSTGLWTVGTVPTAVNPTLTLTAAVTGPGVKTLTSQVETSDQFDPNSTPGNDNPAEDDQSSASVVPLSTLAGSVFLDASGDGTEQPGEPGIAGVVLTLRGTDDRRASVYVQTVTGPDGTYVFSNVRPGTYAVVETQPTAYNDGKVTAGSAGGTAGQNNVGAITLQAGVAATGYTFGERGSTVSGASFVDANSDGQLAEGETGLSGVSVTLQDGEGRTLATTSTSPDGTYQFQNLAAGPYTVIETTPVGYGRSTPTSRVVNLSTSGLPGVNFGATTAALTGFVYFDANNDGVNQENEAGLGGATVVLTGSDANGKAISTTGSTSPDGSYSFPGLLAGTYDLAVIRPAGYLVGKDTPGPAGGTAGVDRLSGIVLGGGVTAGNNNFGELLPAGLAGSVYSDANDDGLMQAGEPGLSQVGLTLTGIDDHGQPVTASATTAGDGSYAFDGLRPGTYVIALARPAGYLSGTDTVGSQGGTAGADVLSGLQLRPGTAGRGNNFAVLAPSSLAGSAFVDSNGDGLPEPGEPGIPGVVVTLSGVDDRGNPVQSVTTTGGDGHYHFDGLRPGTYDLSQSPSLAFGTGTNAVGSTGGLAGTNTVRGVRLTPGQAGTGYTFGQRGAVVSGMAFVDDNGDGVRQVGEPVLGGVKVTALDASGKVVGTATTAPDGTYTLKNLPSGDLRVVFTLTNTGGAPITVIRAMSLTGGQVLDESINANLASGSLTGSVYADRNNNGVRQAGEAGIGGVVMTLTGADTSGRKVVRTVTTSADGRYSFNLLPAGTYTLSEAQPRGYLNGKNAVGSDGGVLAGDTVRTVRLKSGASAAGYNFGELAPATLSGRVYYDYGATGVYQPSDYGMAHVVVTLTGADDLGRPVARETTTDAEGRFSFIGLRPGTYSLTRQTPSVFLDGAVQVGTQGGVSGPNRITVKGLSAATQGRENDFAELARPGCRLLSPGMQEPALRIGPHPTPVPTALINSLMALRNKDHHIPVIAYWLPTLSRWFGQ